MRWGSTALPVRRNGFSRFANRQSLPLGQKGGREPAYPARLVTPRHALRTPAMKADACWQRIGECAQQAGGAQTTMRENLASFRSAMRRAEAGAADQAPEKAARERRGGRVLQRLREARSPRQAAKPADRARAATRTQLGTGTRISNSGSAGTWPRRNSSARPSANTGRHRSTRRFAARPGGLGIGARQRSRHRRETRARPAARAPMWIGGFARIGQRVPSSHLNRPHAVRLPAQHRASMPPALRAAVSRICYAVGIPWEPCHVSPRTGGRSSRVAAV